MQLTIVFLVAFKFGERDSPLVDGLANDDGGDVGGFELKYIHHTTDTTRSNDIKVGELCHHILIEFCGRSSHHTVTRNVSRDDLANATRGVALKECLPTGIALLFEIACPLLIGYQLINLCKGCLCGILALCPRANPGWRCDHP